MEFKQGPKGSWYVAGQADGAIPNGEWVTKTNSEEGDAHPNGEFGQVVSSINVPEELRELAGHEFFYFVTWGLSQVEVGTAGYKLTRPDEEELVRWLLSRVYTNEGVELWLERAKEKEWTMSEMLMRAEGMLGQVAS